jgi:hypothetical protein
MRDAENLLNWLISPPRCALQKPQSSKPTNPSQKIFRKILDEDSVDTATTVATSLDFEKFEHQLHPSHVPTPQALHEFDLGEVLPMTMTSSAIVLQETIGSIQQSLQSLLDKRVPKVQHKHIQDKKQHLSPKSPPASPSTPAKTVSSIDGIPPGTTRMGPEFWEAKATPQLLGDGSRHSRERLASNLCPRSLATSLQSTVSSTSDCDSFEITAVDFESFMDEMEGRDDDSIAEVSRFDGKLSGCFTQRSPTVNQPQNTRSTAGTPLQRQWLSVSSMNLHHYCRPSIRILDEDLVPMGRSSEGFVDASNDD